MRVAVVKAQHTELASWRVTNKRREGHRVVATCRGLEVTGIRTRGSLIQTSLNASQSRESDVEVKIKCHTCVVGALQLEEATILDADRRGIIRQPFRGRPYHQPVVS